jgi:hypothetical protein
MVIQPAPFPALGFDTIVTLDAVHAAALKDQGFKFALRYLGSVTAAELAIILDAGLCFMPVTYSRGAGWAPTAAMGTSDGEEDVQHLKALGILTGCTVWIDLEGVNQTTPASVVSAWVNARATVLKAAGFDVGLYVGSDDILNNVQLYALPTIDRYWRSMSNVPTPQCGFCLLQLYPTVTVANVEIDVDCIQQDWQGRLPYVVGP